MYIGLTYPLLGNNRNRLELFNEFSVCVITSIYALFTDFVYRDDGKSQNDIKF